MSALPAVLSGAGVGFTLGLIGGGGSILATPLLLYVVGIAQPHLAIGTGALAVAANAFLTLIGHTRAGNVRWRCALVFALVGILGALVGSSLGKVVDGQRLLFLFALLMVIVGIHMLRGRTRQGARPSRSAAARHRAEEWWPSPLRSACYRDSSGSEAGF